MLPQKTIRKSSTEVVRDSAAFRWLTWCSFLAQVWLLKANCVKANCVNVFFSVFVVFADR